MSNSKRLDELSAQLASLIEADARLANNLASQPSVYDGPPKAEVGTANIRFYVEPAMVEMLEPRILTGMTFVHLAVTFRVWIAAYDSSLASANSDWSKAADNLFLIVADCVDEDEYWYGGLVQAMAPSASHRNLADAGDTGYRVGYLDFRVLQDKTI